MDCFGSCFSSSGEKSPKDGKSSSSSLKSRKSSKINELIEEERLRLRNQTKILLLGPGESGKSTILKQMRIIHNKAPQRDELETYRPNICRNLVDSMKQTLYALEKMNVRLTSEKSMYYSRIVKEFDFDTQDDNVVIPDEIADAIRFFWHETPLANGFEALTRFSYVLESAPYFFSNVDRICSPGYTPSQEDFLKARIKTVGVMTETFNMKGYDLSMIDVGGQRSERKKWFHNFEDVTVVLFCASLCDYDQFLCEDSGKSRILESLELFDFAINSPYFENSSFVLFLNKKDLFAEKIKVSPLESYFDDYHGGADFDNAKNFILSKYLSLNHSNRVIYKYFTCATDTRMMEVIFDVIEENILMKSLDFVIG